MVLVHIKCCGKLKNPDTIGFRISRKLFENGKLWNEQTLWWKQFQSNMYMHRVLFILLNNTKWWSYYTSNYFENRKAFCILVNSGSTLLTFTSSSNWSLYIYFAKKDKLREFDKRSKHFLLGDNFINSKNLISWPCMDIVSQKKIDVGHYWDLKG